MADEEWYTRSVVVNLNDVLDLIVFSEGVADAMQSDTIELHYNMIFNMIKPVTDEEIETYSERFEQHESVSTHLKRLRDAYQIE